MFLNEGLIAPRILRNKIDEPARICVTVDSELQLDNRKVDSSNILDIEINTVDGSIFYLFKVYIYI